MSDLGLSGNEQAIQEIIWILLEFIAYNQQQPEVYSTACDSHDKANQATVFKLGR